MTDPNWIDAKKQLPICYDFYLVCLNGKDFEVAIFHPDDGTWCLSYCGGAYEIEVDFWMAIPELPNKDAMDPRFTSDEALNAFLRMCKHDSA